MATNTPSPTPSEDNRQNNRDDNMYTALNKIMANSVQSYDDFLNSFTYLKQDMQGKHDDKKVKTKKTEDKKKVTTVNQNANVKPACDTSKTRSIESKPDVYPASSSDIEEETLGEGDSTSRMTKTKVIKTGSMVKFDNFVDPVEDDVEEMDDLSAEGYTASFTAGKSRRSTEVAAEKVDHVIKAGATSRLQDDSDVTNMLETQLSLDEKSTDKLLMNFLADLQNELNEGKPDKLSINENPDTQMDIQNFLSKNKETKQQLADPDEVDFGDDDDNDAMNLLHDDSEKNDVKVKVTEQDLNELSTKRKSDQEKKAKLDEIYRNTLMDSEGNVQIMQSDEGVTDHVDVNENVDKLLFPGQVEERNDQPGSENNRLLDFKATFRETPSNTDHQTESTDLIQPFKLDEDFDYDNVVLSPKFSLEDLRQFKMTVKT